jgi:hypothetical protein
LALDGVVAKDTPPAARVKRREPGPAKEPGKPGRKAVKLNEPKEIPIQVGPSTAYSIQAILRAGRG